MYTNPEPYSTEPQRPVAALGERVRSGHAAGCPLARYAQVITVVARTASDVVTGGASDASSGVAAGSGSRVVRLDPTTLGVGAEYDFGLGYSVQVAIAPDGLTAAACGAPGRAVFDLD